MSDDYTPVQQWRSGVDKELGTVTSEVKYISAEVKEAKSTLSNIEKSILALGEKLDISVGENRKRIDSNSKRGWVSIGLSFVIMCIILVVHFGLTTGGLLSGTTGIVGLIATLKKLI